MTLCVPVAPSLRGWSPRPPCPGCTPPPPPRTAEPPGLHSSARKPARRSQLASALRDTPPGLTEWLLPCHRAAALPAHGRCVPHLVSVPPGCASHLCLPLVLPGCPSVCAARLSHLPVPPACPARLAASGGLSGFGGSGAASGGSGVASRGSAVARTVPTTLRDRVKLRRRFPASCSPGAPSLAQCVLLVPPCLGAQWPSG